MSLFKKKQGLDDTALDRPDDALAPVVDSEAQVPLMTGGARTEGLPEPGEIEGDSANAGRGVGSGVLLLALVVVIAAGSLFAMRMGQVDVTATKASKDIEAKVEQALAKLTNPTALPAGDSLAPQNINTLFRDTDSIVSMFSSDPTQRQVPVDYLKKNPFELVTYHADAAPMSPVAVVDQEANTTRKLKLELKDMDLQTVMGGARPLAVISGEIVKVGQKVGNFTVKTISDRSVELTAGGQSFTLVMSDDNATPAGSSGKRH